MVTVEGATPPAGAGVPGLRHRLRRETSDLHHAVEVAVDLPRSVRTPGDYADLLGRLHRFHAAVEVRLARPSWRDGWPGVGIDLARHRRSSLLALDLRRLGPVADAPRAALRRTEARDAPDLPGVPEPSTFGEALGCLYVLEGSSLGGRVIGPAVRQAVGDVPTAFFDSAGRGHPSPWRALQQGLHRYEAAHGDPDDVIGGARAAFVAFGRQVAGGRFAVGAAL